MNTGQERLSSTKQKVQLPHNLQNVNLDVTYRSHILFERNISLVFPLLEREVAVQDGMFREGRFHETDQTTQKITQRDGTGRVL